MTPEEFNKRETELLGRMPIELRGPLSYMAYEAGHSAGYEEVLWYLDEYIGHLQKPIQDLCIRMCCETAREARQ